MNLDNLNSQLDPYPDGVFDFVDRITIDAQREGSYFRLFSRLAQTWRKNST